MLDYNSLHDLTSYTSKRDRTVISNFGCNPPFIDRGNYSMPPYTSICKYTLTLEPGLGITQVHRNRHGSIRRLRLYINVL